METKYFRLVKAIVEEGSLAKASDRLFLSQSALSHQLSTLEKQLGFPLFTRSRNQWELTLEGKEFHKLALEVLATISRGLHTIDHLREGQRKTLRIGSECYNFFLGFPLFIEEMNKAYPQLKIELQDSSGEHLQQLRDKEIDMALTTALPKEDSLTGHHIYSDYLAAVVNRNSDLADKPYLVASDFEERDLVIHCYPLSTVSIHQLYLKPKDISPGRMIPLKQTEMCLDRVASKSGIFCIAPWMLKPFRLPDSVVLKKIGAEGLRRELYLVQRREDEDANFIRHFRRCLLETHPSQQFRLGVAS
ncbi:MAG: LysR family transcriptional regulator [Bacteroidota bacterium]